MSSLVLLLGLGAMLIVLAAGYCAMLAFHNPQRPAWMETGWADNVTTVTLVAAGVFDIAWVLKLLVALGFDPLVGIIFVFAFGAAGASLLWRKLHMTERLAAAQAGISPFSELRHIRHRQRGGYGRTGFGSGAFGSA